MFEEQYQHWAGLLGRQLWEKEGRNQVAGKLERAKIRCDLMGKEEVSRKIVS